MRTIDNECIHRDFAGFKPKTELFLNCSEERWAGIIGLSRPHLPGDNVLFVRHPLSA